MEKRTFYFAPAYYEWHLTDERGNLIHVMADPAEETCHEDGTPCNYDEIKYLCDSDLESADRSYNEGEGYNGHYLEDPLSKEEMEDAAKVMATALYNYYCVENEETDANSLEF